MFKRVLKAFGLIEDGKVKAAKQAHHEACEKVRRASSKTETALRPPTTEELAEYEGEPDVGTEE